jgi:signal transduction histidine kinase
MGRYRYIENNSNKMIIRTTVFSSKKLRQLTEDILDVTRIESHTLELKKELFNINDIILNVVQDYRDRIERKNNDKHNLKILYEPPKEEKDNIIVEADKGRITQVISNLVDNAIKFTPEGTINITTETIKEDGKKEIGLVSIKDTGTGIDSEIMPKLFSKFATKSFSGTGLGLFISKSIIEAHGGRIWAVNNNNTSNGRGQGKGATFYFTLPIASQQLNELSDIVIDSSSGP